MSLTKPTLNNLRAAGTTTGDVYFPQTKLLLPFDGANGATTTNDSSNRNATVTFTGNAAISTAQSKFGGSSCYFDGTTNTYLNVADTYWNTAINTGDFTIELWARLTSTAYQSILSTRNGDNGWNIVHYGAGNENSQFFFYYHGGGAWNYVNLGQGTRTTPAQNTWYHIAVTRSGNTWKFFLNGTAEDTATITSNITDNSSNGLRISGRPLDSGSLVTGYLDDIRITPGIVRYASNFTPPTTAYLASSGDVNKQVLINETADGVAIGTAGINQARIAKIWVNFDGSGTVAIRDSYNVSSITDNSTGNYTVNFTTAMTDANYSAVMYTNTTDYGMASGNFNNTYTGGLNTRSTSSLRFESYGPPGYQDALLCDLIVFGN